MTHRLIKNSELILYGFVGGGGFFSDGFSGNEVIAALAEFEDGEDIVVRINSGGGFAFDGIAIYNALKQKDANIICKVDGIAASAASIIAMAGDEIEMGDGSMMMIHNASGFAMGTKKDFEKEATVLDKLDGQLATIYAKRTGISEKKVRNMMDEETWMTAEEAEDEGFATKRTEETASTPVVFNYRVYKKPPEQFAALADVWAEQARAAALSVNLPAKETPMTKQAPSPAETPTAITSIDQIPAEMRNQIAAQAAQAERDRINGLEEVALPGYEAMLAEHKKDATKTKADLALAIVASEKTKKAALKASLAEDEKDVKNVRSQPTTANDPVEETKPAEANNETAWRDEYKAGKIKDFATEADYVSFKKNEGRTRILTGRNSK